MKVYLLQIAYVSLTGSGISYGMQSAKNKKEALKKAMKSQKGNECSLISIKRCSSKLVEIIEKHNQQLKGEENE